MDNNRRYLNGDRCPACGGTGKREMERDAHRSGGIVPCGFSTSYRSTSDDIVYVDLRCERGTLSRQHSVPEPERTIMNANDVRAAASRRRSR